MTPPKSGALSTEAEVRGGFLSERSASKRSWKTRRGDSDLFECHYSREGLAREGIVGSLF